MKSRKESYFLSFIVIAFVLIFIMPSYSLAEKYNLPGQRSLYLDVPPDWMDKVAAPDKSMPPTIRFTPVNGDDFLMLITCLWSLKEDSNFNSKDEVKRKVKTEGMESLKQAVESKLKIIGFEGKQSYGYYYRLTDKSLVGKKRVPGNYKYLFRSLVGIGDLLLSVTVLTHEADAVHVDKAIRMLEGATLRYGQSINE